MSGKTLYLLIVIAITLILVGIEAVGIIDEKTLFIVFSLISAAILGYCFALLQKGSVPRLQGVVDVLSYITYTVVSLLVGLGVVPFTVASSTALVIALVRLVVLPSKNAIKS